jgi:hypothetical protein
MMFAKSASHKREGALECKAHDAFLNSTNTIGAQP